MHMQRRGAVYMWRRRVPLTLVDRWGRREIVRSLRTTSRQDAARLARALSTAADNLFDHTARSVGLTTDHIATLAHEWLNKALEGRAEAFTPPPAPVAPVTPPAPPAPKLAPTSLHLSKLVDVYVDAKMADETWSAVTKKHCVGKLKRFAETLDDKPIDEVARDDIRAWRSALAEAELSNNTIRLHFRVVSAMLNWATEEGKSKIGNPTKGLLPPADDPKRDAFTADELEKLFSSPMYTGHQDPEHRAKPGTMLTKDFKFWFPLIGLHTGMRLEEIAQLRTEDVRQIEGVWCFDVTKSKTRAGERQVPIHPRLIALGLLDRVRSLKHERLWPELRENRDGDYGQQFCGWFPEFRRMIGIDREGLVFHSFRHTFVSRLEEDGVDTKMIARIVGHKIKDITSGVYGGKFITPQMRLDAFKDLDFGADLGHLR